MSAIPFPLPAPSVLEQYERVIPGSAARILALAEARAEQEFWIRRLLTREERVTRLMSIASVFLCGFGPLIGFGILFLSKSIAR